MRFAYLGWSVLAASLAGCLAALPTAPAVTEENSPLLAPDLARDLLALPASTVPLVLPPNPGPKAARGQILVNGLPKAGLTIQIQKTTGGTIACVTDAQGWYTAKNLTPGSYLGYYYNASDRNKIGYWRGVAKPVTAMTGASFPAVDLYQVGMTNLPKMDSHIGVPTTFTWVRQAQKVDGCWFRIHDHPFTTFNLTYKSAKLPGDTTSFNFTGGMPLSKTNRYFWGFQWDAGPVGMGGNLYQAVYFDR
ncbi:MAG: hypothetical protein JWM80_6263 [Cyanobacteria bacterium RYN_339]|nr:hypothetical protein [Cyanobacteria bacterium RYN_339]